MFFGKREPRSLESRRRGRYQPTTEGLERRELMAAQLIDLNQAPPGPGTDTIANPPARTTVLPNITGDKTSSSTKAYGVDLVGTVQNQSAGVSVTNVGDVNSDGFDDFVIGAPAVPRQGGTPGSATATAYLVFGSRTTNAQTISDWLAINQNFNGGETGNVGTGRVGNLNQLGNLNTAQTNPYNGLGINASTGLPYAFPFSGIKFVRSLTPGSELGESVGSAFVGTNQTRAFMIGSPGTHDPSTDTNRAGRAYLIWDGGNINGLIGTTVDLDQLGTSGITGLNVTTFLSASTQLTSGRIGQSVSGIGDVITDGIPDIAIGAPEASINGAASGAVFVVSGAAIQTGLTNTIDLATVGNSTSSTTAGVVFTGAAAGDEAGWSVAFAGNVNNLRTSANQSVDDFLIGAPSRIAGNPGTAYLIYGAVDFASRATTIGAGPYSLALVGNTLSPTTNNPFRYFGMSVRGTSPGDLTGWSVSTAGDFNGDRSFADILIGSPGASSTSLNNTGRVDVFYGAAGNPSFGTNPLPAGTLVGNLTLGAVPAGIRRATLFGGTAGELAGYAVSFTGKINATQAGNPILIGAPGFNSNSGTVYVLPPNSNTLTGNNSLLLAFQNPSLAATQLVFTTPGTTNSFFGASLSGRLYVSGKTADSDTTADFIIGAPSYNALASGTVNGGGGIVVEGVSLFPLGTPASVYSPQINVGVVSGTPPSISTSAPDPLKIYVYSIPAAGALPAFRPITDINPQTITVNGVSFAGAAVTDSGQDINGDGINEACVAITPTSNIGLTAGAVNTITIAGSTRSGLSWSGSQDVTVTGGGNNGGGGVSAGPAVVFTPTTTFTPPFGPDRWVPQISTLSRLGSYKPIPLRVALQQWNLPAGFNTRVNNFYNPPKQFREFGYKGAPHAGHRTTTLGYAVFTRSKYKAGTVTTYTHPTPVVPSNLQTERIGSSPKTVRHPKK